MPDRKKISLLITDLDNTLYDWLSCWYSAFDLMIRTIIELTNVDRAMLEKDIRKVHAARGTSECPIHAEELPCIQPRLSRPKTRALVMDALERYLRFHNLKLTPYPHVLSTLCSINNSGAMVVAYTEALGCYAADRVQKLGLDGKLNYLYVPHASRQHLSDSRQLATPADHATLVSTVLAETREGLKKPNPQVLQQILVEVGVKAEHAVYVGDGLFKDVKMAQDARVTDIYAEFGMNRNSPQYEQLRRVSHWTERDVADDRMTDNSKEVTPTHSIQVFSELLGLFDFRAHSAPLKY